MQRLCSAACALAIVFLTGSASAQVFECRHAPAWRCSDSACRPVGEDGPPVFGRNSVTRYDLRRQSATFCQDIEEVDYAAYPRRRGEVRRNCANYRLGVVRSEREPIRNMPSFVVEDPTVGGRGTTIIYQWEAGWRFTQTLTISRSVNVVDGACFRMGD